MELHAADLCWEEQDSLREVTLTCWTDSDFEQSSSRWLLQVKEEIMGDLTDESWHRSGFQSSLTQTQTHKFNISFKDQWEADVSECDVCGCQATDKPTEKKQKNSDFCLIISWLTSPFFDRVTTVPTVTRDEKWFKLWFLKSVINVLRTHWFFFRPSPSISLYFSCIFFYCYTNHLYVLCPL